jgi:acyl-coenzyme A thioesterase 13
MLHAGVLVAVTDTVMGHTCERAVADGTRLVTVSITTDFTGSARQGDWVQGTATVRRTGRRLAFASCELRSGDRLLLAASGVFAVSAPG